MPSKTISNGLVSAKVAALMEGVLRTMFLCKLKIPLVLFAALGVLGTGWGGVSFRAVAKDGQQQIAPASRQEERGRQDEPARGKQNGVGEEHDAAGG